MKTFVHVALALAAMPIGTALADAYKPRYDHALAKAAAEIVAQNIGDIRGGFAFDQKPRFVVLVQTPMAAGENPDGEAH